MAEGVNVQTIEVLRDLEAALRRFAGEANDALLAVEGNIQQTREWLEGRVAHWRHEVERREREMEEAEEALAARRDSGRESSDEGQERFRCARARLEAAQEELATAQRVRTGLEQRIAGYLSHHRRLCHLLASQVPKACVFLGQKSADLRLYLDINAGPGTLVFDTGQRLTQGPVDLSSGAQFGKYAHRAMEEAVEEHHPGEAKSEVSIVIVTSEGKVRRGRIDSLLPGKKQIYDYKFHDLDRMHYGDLVRFLDGTKNQMHAYRTSPDPKVPQGAAVRVYMGRPPSDPGRRLFVEQYLAAEGITVWWGAQLDSSKSEP